MSTGKQPHLITVGVPYLHNFGDGVDGHYCIAVINWDGYTEFWNKGKWCSAGEVFELGKSPGPPVPVPLHTQISFCTRSGPHDGPCNGYRLLSCTAPAPVPTPPTEWQCGSCGHHFPITANDSCPKCLAIVLRKRGPGSHVPPTLFTPPTGAVTITCRLCLGKCRYTVNTVATICTRCNGVGVEAITPHRCLSLYGNEQCEHQFGHELPHQNGKDKWWRV